MQVGVSHTDFEINSELFKPTSSLKLEEIHKITNVYFRSMISWVDLYRAQRKLYCSWNSRSECTWLFQVEKIKSQFAFLRIVLFILPSSSYDWNVLKTDFFRFLESSHFTCLCHRKHRGPMSRPCCDVILRRQRDDQVRISQDSLQSGEWDIQFKITANTINLDELLVLFICILLVSVQFSSV